MARRTGKILAWGLTSLLVLLALAFIALYFVAGSDWARDRALAELHRAAAGAGVELEMAAVEGSLRGPLVIQGLRVGWQGRSVLEVRRLELRPNLLALLGGRIEIRRLSLDQPVLHFPLPRLPEDKSPAGADQEGSSLPPFKVSLGRGLIRGLTLDPHGDWGALERIHDIDADLRLSLDQRGLDGRIELLMGRLDFGGGRPPLAVRGKGRLDDQGVTTPHLEVTAGPNRWDLEGRVSWQGRTSIDAKGTGRINDVTLLPWPWVLPATPAGPLDLHLAMQGRLSQSRMAFTIRQGDARLSLQAPVDLLAAKGVLDLEWSGLRLPQWGLPSLEAELTGKGRLEFAGWPGGEESWGEVSLDLGPGRAWGLAFDQGHIQARLSDPEITLQPSRIAAPWGRLEAAGRWREGRLRLQADFKDLTPPEPLAEAVPEPLRQASLNGIIKVEGAPRDLSLEALLRPSRLSPGITLTQARVSGGLREGRWRVEGLDLEADWGVVSAQGLADAAGVDLVASARRLHLGALAPAAADLGASLPDLAGEVDLTAALKGPWAWPALEMNLKGHDLALGESRLARLTANASLDRLWGPPRGVVDLEAAGLEAGGRRLAGLNALAVLGGHGLDLTVEGKVEGWESRARVLAPLATAFPLTLSLQELVLRPPAQEEPWRLVSAANLVLGKGGYSLRGLDLRHEQEHLLIDASVDPNGVLAGRLRVRDLLLAPWLKEKDIPPNTSLTLWAGLGGTLAQPVLRMRGELTGIKWADSPPMDLSLESDYHDGKLWLDGLLRAGGRPVSDLEGTLGLGISLRPFRIAPSGHGVDLRLTATHLPLALLGPLLPGVSSMGGTGALELDLKGTLGDPQLTGRLAVPDGRVALAATGQEFSGIDLELTVDGARVTIKKAHLAAGGTLDIKGWVELPFGQRGAADLELSAQGFQASLGVYGQVTSDAAITARGPLDALQIQGTVTPTAAEVNIDLTPPPNLDDVVMIDPGQKPPPIQRDQGPKPIYLPGPLDGATVDLKADLNRGLRVDMGEGWVIAAGQARITKEPGGPLVFHDVITIDQGVFFMQGKRFKVENGLIEFGDKNLADPSLSAEVTHQAGRVRVTIAISGTASDPQFQFSSEPPMSEADILSTVIFGQPASSLSQEQSRDLSAQALSLVGSAGAQKLDQVLGKGITPDVITFRETEQGTALEAGKYLGSDLYLSYRQNISERRRQSVGLEYRFNQHFSIESEFGDEESTGVDLIFNYDFE